MSGSQDESFSRRLGYKRPDPEITIRDDAPENFRFVMLHECNIRPQTLRSIVCVALRVRSDLFNWSDLNIWSEVENLVYACEWFRVYDITEAIYAHLADDLVKAEAFEDAINKSFREMGIGWQLKDGQIQTRGDDAHEALVKTASAALDEASLPTARSELGEAIHDLSRRPEPDLSGAVHHAMAALECTAREAAGDANSTLGEIVKKNPNLFPRPLDEVVAKAWGYSSEMARHAKEKRDLNRPEVQLTVGLAAVVSTYLTEKLRK